MTRLEKAKHKSCIDILLDSGYSPVDKQRGAYMFLSPWRNENVPSLCVYENNKWVDFGEDIRAKDSVDLYSRLHGTNFKKSLDKLLDEDFSNVEKLEFNKKPGITVRDVRKITNKSLEDYIKSRKICVDLARIYCKELDIEFARSPGKLRTVIGFKNNLGGYEVRSSFYKRSVSPKSITSIEGGIESLVFEGFFELLSYLMWIRKDSTDNSIIVLNSTSMWMIALNYMKDFNLNHLFLNNDESGQKKISEMSSLTKCIDHSNKYSEYNDLNDFLRGIKI